MRPSALFRVAARITAARGRLVFPKADEHKSEFDALFKDPTDTTLRRLLSQRTSPDHENECQFQAMLTAIWAVMHGKEHDFKLLSRGPAHLIGSVGGHIYDYTPTPKDVLNKPVHEVGAPSRSFYINSAKEAVKEYTRMESP